MNTKVTEGTYWNKLTEIGWVRYLPKSQHSKLRAKLHEIVKTNPEWAYLALTHFAFDSECIDEPGAYSKIIKSLAKESRGLFHPTRVKEEYVTLGKRRHGIKVSLRHERKPFSVTVEQFNDHFQNGVLQLVNAAIAATSAKERFVELPDIDQCINLVLVPRSLYYLAVEKDLIPANDKYDGGDFEAF